MNLIPMPRKIQYIKEEFKLKKEVNIILDYNCSFDDLNSAILLQEEINNTFGFKVNITKALNWARATWREISSHWPREAESATRAGASVSSLSRGAGSG